MTNTTVGREPVQIVALQFPRCAHVHGTAPCTATQTGDDKCFNTYATCNDRANYSHTPDAQLESQYDGLTSAVTSYNQRITTAEVANADRSADLFFAVDVAFTDDPDGCILEIGSSTTALYLGCNGGANTLVFRAGDGATGTPTNAAKISISTSGLAERTGTLYGTVDVSANRVDLHFFDRVTRVMELLGTATASGSFSAWADANDGALGFVNGTTATDEDTSDFNGYLGELRLYPDSAAPPIDTANRSYLEFYYFDDGRTAKPSDDIFIFPYVEGRVQTQASYLNIGAASDNATAIGTRAVASVTMTDAPSTDFIVDPYLSDRTYDPYERSTFWAKLRARQKFGIKNARMIVYDGYDGQALSAMRKREYLVESLSRPSNGKIQIKAKDPLVKTQVQRAKFPLASPGYLFEEIDEVATSMTVAGATLADYAEPPSFVRINDEIMAYSAIAEAPGNRLTFTMTRAQLGTTADSHDPDDSVQWVKRYVEEPLYNVLLDLLADFRSSAIPMQYIKASDIKAEIEEYLNPYILTATIAEPVAVDDLLNELSEQCIFSLWYDEIAQGVDMRALRAVDAQPANINETANIVEGSIRVIDKPEDRLSQMWLFFNQRNPTEPLDEKKNYQSVQVTANLESEDLRRYGDSAIRESFSRWLSTFSLALNTTSRTVARLQDVPVMVEFQADAKDRDTLTIGSYITISTDEIVDARGAQSTERFYFIISAQETIPGELLDVVAIDATAGGILCRIVADATPDYVGDGSEAFGAGYISDANGFMSDGKEGCRIQ